MGKKVAIISDIHGNLEAMTSVLGDIETRNVDAIYCLGDVIGYGPNPVECLELAFKHCEFIIYGNHELGVLEGAYGVHRIAKEAMDWTREQLKPSWLSLAKTRRLWEKLKKLRVSHTVDGHLFVHGSPRDPTYEYVLPSDTEDIFGDVPKKIKEIFEHFDGLCFLGHTHKPGIITEDSKWFSPPSFDGIWELKRNEKLVCNVGSVGQPRDNDNRACYITLTEKEIRYHRVPYDLKKTQEKIRKIPQLDDRLAKRIEQGA